MRRRLIVAALALAAPAPAEAMTVGSTSYCLQGTMADGSYTRWGSVASNLHPLGTRIKVTRPRGGFFGMKRFVVRDRIGWGSQLDFWHASCAGSRAWGRRTVRYRVLGR